MQMATQPNSGFRHDGTLNSMMSRHAINFQSGAVNSTSEMIPMGAYFGPSSGMSGVNFPGNSGVNMINAAPPGLLQSGNSSASSLLLDSVPGLKIDASLASEWSAEEQYKLEEGLEKYKDKPSIMKYIKIAATLPDKTVRDVALRCRWMTRKRRKAEELNGGKKTSSSKDKQVGLSSKLSLPSVLPHNMASYPFLMPHASSNEHITCKDLSGNAIHLLEQNVQAYSQIRANLSLYKLQDNLDLFYQTRNNLITILNDMSNMPGIMSQMPPLPVSINEDLASSILTNTSLLADLFGTWRNCWFCNVLVLVSCSCGLLFHLEQLLRKSCCLHNTNIAIPSSFYRAFFSVIVLWLLIKIACFSHLITIAVQEFFFVCTIYMRSRC